MSTDVVAPEGDPRGIPRLPQDLLELVLREFACPWRTSPRFLRVARAWLACARPRRRQVVPHPFFVWTARLDSDLPYHKPVNIVYEDSAYRRRVDAALGRMGEQPYEQLMCRDVLSCTGARVLVAVAASEGRARTYACPYDDDGPAVDALRLVTVRRECEADVPTSDELEVRVCPRSQPQLFAWCVVRARARQHGIIINGCDHGIGEPAGVCLHPDEIRWRRHGGRLGAV